MVGRSLGGSKLDKIEHKGAGSLKVTGVSSSSDSVLFCLWFFGWVT